MEIKVLKDILSANDQIAQENRQLLDSNGIFTVNVMSSPGAGKTSLILETIKRLKGDVKIGVIEGDVSSSIDAETIGKEGVPVIQINTGGECHLDASMIYRALSNLPLQDIELLFVENVGNLICTAEFTIGAHKNLVISSTPEGFDKPLKWNKIVSKTCIMGGGKLAANGRSSHSAARPRNPESTPWIPWSSTGMTGGEVVRLS